MSNRNHNLNNVTGNEEPKKAEKAKEKFIQINWKAGAKKLAKFGIGFCTLTGAVCAGSYAAGALQARKNLGPVTEHETVTKLTDT